MKLVREYLNEEKSLYQKAYSLTLHQIENNVKNLRWLTHAIEGIYGTIAINYGLGRSDEVVKGIKDAIYDFVADEVYGGTEPTFTTDESYDWWENLNDSYFYIREYNRGAKINLKDEYQIKGPIFENE